MDLDLAWVNSKTSRQSWCYAVAFKRSIISGTIYHCTVLLLGLSRRDHVRPALKELHWLPVVYRIQFKLALVMFTIHTRRCPDYLTDSVQACNSDPARTRLRSASSSDYNVPRTRTRFGDGAFSLVGSVVWNSLPAAVREADSFHSFRRKLKTHLFRPLCFNDWLFFFTNFCNAFLVWCSVGRA